jgi:hypothetical protein
MFGEARFTSLLIGLTIVAGIARGHAAPVQWAAEESTRTSSHALLETLADVGVLCGVHRLGTKRPSPFRRRRIAATLAGCAAVSLIAAQPVMAEASSTYNVSGTFTVARRSRVRSSPRHLVVAAPLRIGQATNCIFRPPV